ncbi:unnamed protein product, partial [Meganyctiphanes norvegica]
MADLICKSQILMFDSSFERLVEEAKVFLYKMKIFIRTQYTTFRDNSAIRLNKLGSLLVADIYVRPSGSANFNNILLNMNMAVKRFKISLNPLIVFGYIALHFYASIVDKILDQNFRIAYIVTNKKNALKTELTFINAFKKKIMGLEPRSGRPYCCLRTCRRVSEGIRATGGPQRFCGPNQFKFHATGVVAEENCLMRDKVKDKQKPPYIIEIITLGLNLPEFVKNEIRSVVPYVFFKLEGFKLNKIIKTMQDEEQRFYTCIPLHIGMQEEEQRFSTWMPIFYHYLVQGGTKPSSSRKFWAQVCMMKGSRNILEYLINVKRIAIKLREWVNFDEKVPPVDSLAEVKGASLVKGIPFSVKDPEVAGNDIFIKLVPMEAHQASSMYSEEKAKLLRQVCSRIHDKNQELETYLASMQLDDISALQTDDQIPQEIIECCADLNARNGVKQLQDIMAKISNSYHDINTALNKLTSIIEEEESKESEFKVVLGKRGAPPNMILGELKREAAKYREAHKSAQDNNTALHRAITQHMPNLKTLAQPLDQIALTIPSPATVEAGGDQGAKAEVQKLMGKVGEMKSQRELLEQQLRADLQNDDVTKQLVTSQDDMEDFFQDQLKKHDQKIATLDQNMTAQNNILQALSEANAAYAGTRRLTNQTQIQRTEMIASLLASHGAYQNIVKKAETAHEFYAKLESQVNKLLSRVKSVCRVHEEEREEQLSANVKKLTGGLNKGGMNVPGGPYIPPASVSHSDSSSSSGPKLKDFLAHMKDGGYNYNDAASAYTSPSNAYSNPASTYSSSIRPAPLGSEQTEGLTSNSSIGGANSHTSASYGAVSAYPPSAPSPAPSPAPHSSPYKSNASPYHSQGHYPMPAASGVGAAAAGTASFIATGGNDVATGSYGGTVQHPSSYQYSQQYYSAYGSYPPGAASAGSTTGVVQPQSSGSRATVSAVQPPGATAGAGYGYSAGIPTTGIYSGAKSAVAGADSSSSNTSVAAAGSAQPLVSSNTNTQQYNQYPNKGASYQYYGQQQPALPGAPPVSVPSGSTTATGETSATRTASETSYPQNSLGSSQSAYIGSGGSSNQVSSSHPYYSYQYPQGPYSSSSSNSQPSATIGTLSTAGGQQIYTGQPAPSQNTQTYNGQQPTVSQINANQNASGYNYYPSTYNVNANTSISSNTFSTSVAATTVSNSNVTNMYPGSRQWSNYQGYGQYGTPSSTTTTQSSYGQYGAAATQYGETSTSAVTTHATTISSVHNQYPYSSVTTGQSSTSTYTSGAYAGDHSTQQQQYWNQYGSYSQPTHPVQQQQQPGHPAQQMTGPQHPSSYPAQQQQQHPSNPSHQKPSQIPSVVSGAGAAIPSSFNAAGVVTAAAASGRSSINGHSSDGAIQQQQQPQQKQKQVGGSVSSITSGISNLDLLSGIELTTQTTGSQWSPLTPQPAASGAEATTSPSSVPSTTCETAAPPDVTSVAGAATSASSISSSSITNLPNVLSTSSTSSSPCSSSSVSCTMSTAAIIDLAKKATPRVAVDPLSNDDTLKLMAEETERLSRYVEGLSKQPINGPSNLETKWKEISDMLDKECGSLKVSIGRCYPLKNRFADILPFDHTRVLLPSKRDDYINASHVKMLSVSDSMAMVVTQAPLPSTMVDFWALIWEQQMELIVTLHSDAEVKGQVYWPSEAGSHLEFGHISITLHNVVEGQGSGRPSGPCWSKRVFHISHQQTKITRVVIQIQFLGWPPSSMPESPGPLLQFLCEVHSLHQQQRNKLRPVLVHCVPGIGRSGVFAILSALVKQLHTSKLDCHSILIQQEHGTLQVEDTILFPNFMGLYFAK